jgi:hypothetical protein
MRELPSLFRVTVIKHYYYSDVLEQVVPPSRVRRGDYAFPWPDEVKGLGPLRVDAYDRCSRCGVGSWVRYGSTVLCLGCAKKPR